MIIIWLATSNMTGRRSTSELKKVVSSTTNAMNQRQRKSRLKRLMAVPVPSNRNEAMEYWSCRLNVARQLGPDHEDKIRVLAERHLAKLPASKDPHQGRDDVSKRSENSGVGYGQMTRPKGS